MAEHMDNATTRPVEGALQAHYCAVPDAAFVAALERRLLAEGHAMPAYGAGALSREAREGKAANATAIRCHSRERSDEESWLHRQTRHAEARILRSPGLQPWSLRMTVRETYGHSTAVVKSFVSFAVQTPCRRWALGAAALVLAIAVALAAGGPRQVWAQVQRLLGYVPGIGFVDLDEARVLAAPVAVTREGVTLYVEQAIARSSGTSFVIRAEGLPPVEPAPPGDAPTLRLPDGRELAKRAYALHFGEGRIEFPPLPEGVYRATLVLPRLPMVPAGAAPEGWAVPLVLQPATGELAAALFPQPYRPEAAADSHEGVTVRVLEVAQSADETALRVLLEWHDPQRYPFATLSGNTYLRDDLGHSYGLATHPGNGSFVETEVIEIDPSAPRPTPAPASIEETVAFSPASPQAHELTLVVDEIGMRVPAGVAFAIDLGDDPQLGDCWPLAIDLEVAGAPLRVAAARLVEDAGAQPGRRIALELDILPRDGGGSTTVTSLDLDGTAARLSGGGSSYSGNSGRIRSSLYLAEGAPLPRGKVELRASSAFATLRGPWTVTWPVPGAGAEGAAGVAVLHPQASDRVGGLTLGVDEAVLSDRLTCVRLALQGAPEGVTLSGLDSFAAIAPGERARLTDDRGGDYGLPNGTFVRWQPAGDRAPDLASLTFAPLQPLAQRLTLRLPALRLAWPDAVAFDVEVPAGVALDLQDDEQRARTRVSAPWAVDIPLEVADYTLRFAEARLEETSGTVMLRLTSAPYTPQSNERQLSGLRLAAVTGPGGRAVDVAGAMSTAGPLAQHEQTAVLLIDVVDPGSGAVQPGRYHVELGGATVAVRGPWVLTWGVAGR